MTAENTWPQTTTRIWKSILCILFLGLTYYFSHVSRTDFVQVSAVYFGLFIAYLMLLHPKWGSDKYHFRYVLITAIAARLLFLLSEPTLSDDYFRFIWDGRLLANGINPFDHTPTELMQWGLPAGGNWEVLYERMNSKEYFSLYPPINQLIFYIANQVSPTFIFPAVLVIKLFILGAELLALLALYRICTVLGYNIRIVLWYALNPLVIIEFCGNLHFEALMITFLLLSIWMLIRGRTVFGAMAFAGAILTKLHPLMLLPFIIKYLGWKKGLLFTSIAILLSLIAFAAFLLPADVAAVRFSNMADSFRLYYENFEFNAGIYYIFRWIGFQFYGYNPIDKIGKLMLIFNLLILLLLLVRMKRSHHALIGIFFFAYLAYNIFATTVHPWYILPMLPLALLVNYKSATLWTALVFLSYFAYSQPDWHENFGLLTLEYTCIFAFLLYEFNDRNKLHEIIS